MRGRNIYLNFFLVFLKINNPESFIVLVYTASKVILIE